MNELGRKTIVGFAQLVAALLIFLFVPAWTFHFWQAWVYLGVFVGASVLVTLYLWAHDRELLQRRLKAGPAAEQQGTQKIIQAFAALGFVATMIVPALDHHFGWSTVPAGLVVLGDLMVALGFLAIFFVYRANTFTAATIQVVQDQRVITTGPYALVRHPMYAGALVMLLGTPLALGSWWGLLVMAPMTATIVWRLLDEERFLARSLAGYEEYRQKVRYRLIPFVW